MKLISLNAWGGKVYKPLINFIESQNNKVDIFCLQEVFDSKENIFSNGSKSNLLSDVRNILADYDSYFYPIFSGYDLTEVVDVEMFFGQATFVRRNHKVDKSGSLFVFREKLLSSEDFKKEKIKEQMGIVSLPRNINYVILKDKTVIVNFHGFWIPGDKKDTPERIEQSKKLSNFLNSFENRKILCGDFNLNPNTKSMKMIEEGMINLIKDYNIETTRSKIYKRGERYADYILVSKDLNVFDFEVLQDQVSDHLPLYLEFK